jgi:enoyl-CoA hydratase/carnithine racemase
MARDDVLVERNGPLTTVIINRPQARNACRVETVKALHDAFMAFEADATAKVAVLTGAGDSFCAGADLKELASGEALGFCWAGEDKGVTRRSLSKPVIAAVEGYAVAGGLELALWCDLRMAAADATFGVFCRRWGVPLIDGGTVRLPRLIGTSRALDLILTGRAVGAVEAERIGLVNRVVPRGTALTAARTWAAELAALPQECLRHDRQSVLDQHGLPEDAAMLRELEHGRRSLAQADDGVRRFRAGEGRHGAG